MAAGEELERIVAALQRYASPGAATVTRRERIPDRDTGEAREVDVVVRMMLGHLPVLVAFECRDRSAPADARWIEQLAQKKRTIGASELYAVSASGFTGPAREKARALGVHALTLEDVTDAALEVWTRNLTLAQIDVKWTIDGAFAVRLDAFEVFEIGLMRQHVRDAPVVKYADAHGGYPLYGLFQLRYASPEARARTVRVGPGEDHLVEVGGVFPEVTRGVPHDGSIVSDQYDWLLPRGMQLVTTDGPCDVDVLVINTRAWAEARVLPPMKPVLVQRPDGRYEAHGSHDLQIAGGGTVRMNVVAEPVAG